MLVNKKYDVLSTKKVGEKTIWNRVGKVIEFENGNMILEMYHTPEITYVVKEQRVNTIKNQTPESTSPNDDINLDDIPF